MYLDIWAITAVSIALVLSIITLIYAVSENALLQKEIIRLRFRIRDLNKVVERHDF